ncbi:hypothetical protein N7532_003723, partial [Penicillium argentinense]
MVLTSSMACIEHRSYRRRTPATGIAATARVIRGIIFPVLISNLAGLVGFPWVPLGDPDNWTDQRSVLTQRNDRHPSAERSPLLIIDNSYSLDRLCPPNPTGISPSYAQLHGLDDSLAYNLSSILIAASIIGRIVPGYFADRDRHH